MTKQKPNGIKQILTPAKGNNMFTALSIQFKIAIFLLIGLIAGYVWYDVIIKPQHEIAELKETVKKTNGKSTEIVNIINDEDAKRTEELINEIITDDNITIHTRGTLFF